jgi:hypothetical protein
MVELREVVLGCSAFQESSIGFVGALRIITRGRFCPYPDGWSGFEIRFQDSARLKRRHRYRRVSS